MTDITRIDWRIAQGDMSIQDLAAFAAYAQTRLAREFPGTALAIETTTNASSGRLVVETREDAETDAVGHLYRAREDAEAQIGRLWDDYCAQ